MMSLLLTFVSLAGVVAAAGMVLARCADRIAELTRLGHLLVGSILLAGATSLPELTVDLTAVRLGMPDLAAGDLLGSSLMNLLILAVCDLSFYSRGQMLSRAAAGHALSGLVGIALTGIVGMSLITARSFPDLTVGPLSVPSLLLLLGYGLGVRLVFLDQRLSVRESAEARGESPVATPEHSPWEWSQLVKPIGGFLAGTVVLFLAGPRLAETAGELADLSGLGKTFIGTTLVALCTSLPELVASLAALRLKAFDLAVGNLFGSNAFNMILFVPLDALHPGPLFVSLSPTHAISCLAAVVGTAIAVMGQLYRVERRHYSLIEPDAWLVLLSIVGSLYLVYRIGT